MLLRIGAGVAAFGLFVALFSFEDPTFGLVVFGIGVAFLFAALVTYLQSAVVERGRRRRR